MIYVAHLWFHNGITATKNSYMKIIIELSDVEVKGIKEYLKEVGDILNPTKTEITKEISEIVHGNLYAKQCAVSDYIKIQEMNRLKINK